MTETPKSPFLATLTERGFIHQTSDMAGLDKLAAEGFSFLLSIKYIAMILIGGVATVSGSIMGAFFIIFLPKVVEFLAGLPGLSHVISKDPAGMINTFQFEQILFGLFIVGFLILEPMGLYGIWIRVRNYWKGWPFSY